MVMKTLHEAIVQKREAAELAVRDAKNARKALCDHIRKTGVSLRKKLIKDGEYLATQMIDLPASPSRLGMKVRFRVSSATSDAVERWLIDNGWNITFVVPQGNAVFEIYAY